MISENKNLCLFSITRRIWGFLLFALLNVGWILQLILAGSEQSPSLDQIGHTCHGMAITLLAITLGLASVLTVKPFLARWSSRSHFNHSNWVQSLAVYITFILLAIRIIPDLLRVWTRRSPTNLSYILTGMVPEFFIVCGWIWLGRGICRWDRRFKKLGHKAPEILRRMWFGWKILEYEKRYLERDTSIYSTISSSLVLPDKPQTCSIEVPGLLDYIEYFTSYDLVQRQEKLLARPGILAAAEKLMPNLASPSPLGGLNTQAHTEEILAQRLRDFKTACSGRVTFFRKEVYPREGSPSELEASSIFMTTLSKPPTRSLDCGAKFYNREEVVQLVRLLRTLCQAAVSNLCFKVPLSHSVFHYPNWIVDIPETLDRMKSYLVAVNGYSFHEADAIVAKWGEHILNERGPPIVRWENDYVRREANTHPYLYWFLDDV
jgi:hypothetical protein